MRKYIFSIRVTEDWHKKAKSEAALLGIPLGKFVEMAVNEYIEKNKKAG